MDIDYFKSQKLFTETQPKEITLNSKETTYLKEVQERSLSELQPNQRERVTPKTPKKRKSEVEEVHDSNTNGYGTISKETVRREQPAPREVTQNGLSQSAPKNAPPTPPPQKVDAPKEVTEPTEERGALLDSIKRGKSLKKVKTVDKSSPILDRK